MLTKASLSSETLASVLEQSTDCVKLIDVTGNVLWMNANGMCAMEIDSACELEAKRWTDLWPKSAEPLIADAYRNATDGAVARFTAFCPTAKGSDRWWDVSLSRVNDAGGAMAGYVAISRDVTAAHLSRESMRTLVAEMRHRLRNTYAIMCSLMRGFARGDEAREDFAAEMTDRMMALAKAQSLFDNDNAPTDLTTLVEALVQPFDSGNCTVTITPDSASTAISKDNADAIALVIGELSVNSGKHGALTHGGSIEIRTVPQPSAVTIEWVETSNAAVRATQREGGQGLTLIERIVAARRGHFGIDWMANGLTARLSVST